MHLKKHLALPYQIVDRRASHAGKAGPGMLAFADAKMRNWIVDPDDVILAEITPSGLR